MPGDGLWERRCGERENSIPDLPQNHAKKYTAPGEWLILTTLLRARRAWPTRRRSTNSRSFSRGLLYSVPTPRAYTNNSRVAAPEPTELIGTDRNGSERTRPDRNGCETLGWQGMPSGKNGHHPGSWKPSQRSYPRLGSNRAGSKNANANANVNVGGAGCAGLLFVFPNMLVCCSFDWGNLGNLGNLVLGEGDCSWRVFH